MDKKLDGESRLLSEFNVLLRDKRGLLTESGKIERRLLDCTYRMNGVRLRVNEHEYEKWWKKIHDAYEEGNKKVEEKIWKGFNVSSRKDCEGYFIKKLGFRPEWTRKGNVIINSEVLKEWADQGCEEAELVKEARKRKGKLSQMVEWKKEVEEGVVSPKWYQYGTPHGRYSCSDPNLQNRIIEIRETIYPTESGRVFISYDMGQAEYVTWAGLSKDKHLIEIFETGQDLHEKMGELVSKYYEGNLSIRDVGKRFNYALLYMMKNRTLAKSLGVEEKVAKEVMKEYWKRGVDSVEYREDILKKAMEEGEVATYFGRRRMTKGLEPKTIWHHHNAGTAAEILKLKQARVYEALMKEETLDKKWRFVIQMHDEIIVEAEESCVDQVNGIMKENFDVKEEGFPKFKVDCRIGESWGAVSKERAK